MQRRTFLQMIAALAAGGAIPADATVSVNPNHPLFPGLIGLLVPQGLGYCDAIRGQSVPCIVNTVPPVVVNMPDGQMIQTSGATNCSIDVGDAFAPWLQTPDRVTMALRFVDNTGASLNQYSLSTRTVLAQNGFAFRTHRISAGGVGVQWGEAPSNCDIADAHANDGQPHSCLMTLDRIADDVSLYYDSAAKTRRVTGSGDWSSWHLNGDVIRIGRQGRTIYHKAQIGVLWFWDRVLTPPEAATFFADPWGLLQP